MNQKIYCPFCDKLGVEAVQRVGYTGVTTSRGSGQSSSRNQWVQGKLLILSGCSECGKTEEEIKRFYK